MGPEPVAEGPESRIVASVAAGRLRPALAKALPGLSRGERDVLLLVALGRLGYGEVARAPGISLGTVRSRLGRARSKLHAVLDKEAIDG